MTGSPVVTANPSLRIAAPKTSDTHHPQGCIDPVRDDEID
jgi:hypothetical protein